MPFGIDSNTATTFVMPLAQQAVQTMPSAILPSYKQTAQAISPYLPLAIQPDNDNKDLANNQEHSAYSQASQHFKAGALPWVGDSGATQANTGLWYLTQALQNQWAQQQAWNTQQLKALEHAQKQLALLQSRLNLLEQDNQGINKNLSTRYLNQSAPARPVHGAPSNNLNVVA